MASHPSIGPGAGRAPVARRRPAYVKFGSGARAYLLTRDLRPPTWAKLVHVDSRTARGVLDRAARRDPGFVRRLRTALATDFGPAGQQGADGQILDRAAMLIVRQRLSLYDLGEVPKPPQPAVDALRQRPAATTGAALKDNAPAPVGLPARMLVVIEAMRHIPAGELGKDAGEFLALLAAAGVAARLATVVAAWALSHLTGAGWVIDAGLIGYGLWAIGVGIFAMLDTLLGIVRAIQGARTVGELKRQARPLAKLLVEAGVTVVVAFFLKGLKRRQGVKPSQSPAAPRGDSPASSRTPNGPAEPAPRKPVPVPPPGPRIVSPRGPVDLGEFRRLNVPDPATGKLRPGEASAAAELQQVLGGRLERMAGPSGADFNVVSGSQAGKSVDFLLTPGTVKEANGINQFFVKNANRFSVQLDEHLRKADIVPIDSRFLTSQNQKVLMDMVGKVSPSDQSRIVIFR